MARDFNKSTSNYLEAASAVVTAVPLTIACHALYDTAEDMVLVSICDFSGQGGFYVSYENVGQQLAAYTFDGGGWSGAKKAAPSAGTKFHAAGVFASATSRTAYVDGVAGTANTVSHTPTGLDQTNVGVYSTGSAYYSPFDGPIAEIGIWDVVLTAGEIAALSDGLSPLSVRPGNLVAYWPLLGRTSPERDLVGGVDLAITGTVPQRVHPRVYRPAPFNFYIPPAAAVGDVTDIEFAGTLGKGQQWPVIMPDEVVSY